MKYSQLKQHQQEHKTLPSKGLRGQQPLKENLSPENSRVSGHGILRVANETHHPDTLF